MNQSFILYIFIIGLVYLISIFNYSGYFVYLTLDQIDIVILLSSLVFILFLFILSLFFLSYFLILGSIDLIVDIFIPNVSAEDRQSLSQDSFIKAFDLYLIYLKSFYLSYPKSLLFLLFIPFFLFIFPSDFIKPINVFFIFYLLVFLILHFFIHNSVFQKELKRRSIEMKFKKWHISCIYLITVFAIFFPGTIVILALVYHTYIWSVFLLPLFILMSVYLLEKTLNSIDKNYLYKIIKENKVLIVKLAFEYLPNLVSRGTKNIFILLIIIVVIFTHLPLMRELLFFPVKYLNIGLYNTTLVVKTTSHRTEEIRGFLIFRTSKEYIIRTKDENGTEVIKHIPITDVIEERIEKKMP